MWGTVTKIVLLGLCLSLSPSAANNDWYKNSLIYQIYPRSFKDSNGDGIGDLNGITSKLEHIADIGVDALWLSPIYTSPQADFGYDISNFTDVNPEYGTLDDFDRLVAKAKSLGLKVILDYVPNHSSHEHPWFKKSIQKIKPYDDYYIWRNATYVNGTRQPPNNWLSAFGGSAWEWNNQREQYYLHQFVAGQPDLNYRNKDLDQEMKNVFSFWMDRGVEGFRIDAINFMFEDTRFLDEPSANRPDLPPDDYDSLDHIYTKNLNETYTVLSSWRKLLDEHSNKIKGDYKMLLTEAYADFDLTVKYYNAGSTVPFNFMFMAELNNQSSAPDFKRFIDRWMNNLPSKDTVANWVVGNHDNHRAASRYGKQRADQLNMLSMILPGVSVVYNGDEIGMLDRDFTYEETVDPAGCQAGPDRYYLKSRDPERTPFQWDNSTSAGFSTSNKTWLPVNSNYKTLNLDIQKNSLISHYKVFQDMIALKRTPIIESGSLESILVTEKVLGVVRRFLGSTIVLLINFSNSDVQVDARTWLNIPEQLLIYTASVGSNINSGTKIKTSSYVLPGASSVVLVSSNVF
ncbi:maltase 1-like [Vespa mandarinia]|uniref:maltase 1-like n=1 Tax=Vespa mandarinia TaxID=7446 RepID=UPI00160A1E66|nr:maltase 1-like [Vespa mandarinia]